MVGGLGAHCILGLILNALLFDTLWLLHIVEVDVDIGSPDADVTIEAEAGDVEGITPTFRMDLGPVNIAGMEALAHEEQVIVVHVIQSVSTLDIFLGEVPDADRSISRSRNQKVIIPIPVHIMNQIIVALQNDLQIVRIVLNIEDLDNGSIIWLGASSCQVLAPMRKLQSEASLGLGGELPDKPIGQLGLQLSKLVPSLEPLDYGQVIFFLNGVIASSSLESLLNTKFLISTFHFPWSPRNMIIILQSIRFVNKL